MATNTAPVKPALREFRRQSSHTLRKTVTFADAGIAAGIAFPASLPAGSVVTGTTIVVETAFSAGAGLTVGSTPTGTDLVAAADSAATAAGVKRPDRATALGRLAADTTPYVALTGAPTAGVATIVLHYTPNNDA